MAISNEKMAKELEAQKKRVMALKYLESQGQTLTRDLTELRKEKKVGDNTLELLLKDKVSNASSKELENITKTALLQQQSRLTITAASSSGGGKSIIEMSGETIAITCSNGVEWKKSIHVASRQECWVNTSTGETRFDDPATVQNAVITDSTASSSNGAAPRTTRKIDSSSSLSSNTNANTNNAKKRRLLDIDPLDPTQGKGGHSDSVGKMADSTASGPLWQQRPYPAPGKALLMQKQQQQKKTTPLAGPIFMSSNVKK